MITLSALRKPLPYVPSSLLYTICLPSFESRVYRIVITAWSLLSQMRSLNLTGAGPLRWEPPPYGGAIDRTPVQRDIPVFGCMLHSYSRQVLCLPVRPLLGSRKWLAGSYIRLRHPLGWCVTSVLQNLYRVTGSYIRSLCVSDG